ncbi:hypothetical protein HPB50_000894 [Hyalomma asiaticum]|uniref:Uncharacterized protein n=1 Tax=Hyalomma asiaticum TaxID=266040 RepID=A0ACB7SD36_HYAAI|nr:hypothetical protein HPB50_000894 [Hyalomma asiaticum]
MSATKGQLAVIATTAATTNGKRKKVSLENASARDSRDGEDARRVREDLSDNSHLFWSRNGPYAHEKTASRRPFESVSGGGWPLSGAIDAGDCGGYERRTIEGGLWAPWAQRGRPLSSRAAFDGETRRALRHDEHLVKRYFSGHFDQYARKTPVHHDV